MAKNRKPKPDSDAERMLSAPSPRVWTEFTPTQLRSAIRQAEYGNLSYAVSVCDWLLRDDRVQAALNARVNGLLGLEPTFEPAGDRRRSNRAVKALEADEDWWTAYPESQLSLMLRWGILLGVAPMRHSWTERDDHNKRLLPMPKFWHPQTLTQDQQTKAWRITDNKSQYHDVVPGDGVWILYTPYGQDRAAAGGCWASLARWALVKDLAIWDNARHGEKSSTLVATSEKETTQKQRRELAEDLQSSGADRIVALAAGFDLKLVEVGANTTQIYQSQIKAADEAIAVVIRGGNLSTVTKEGSLAAATQQHDTGDGANLRFDAESVTTTLHDQSLTWWARLNFGDPNLAPWPVYPVEPEEDKSQSAETIKTLGEGLTTLDTLGFEFDEKKLIERFNLDFITGRPNPTRVPAPPVAPGADPAAPAPAPKPKKKEDKSKGQFVAQLASGATADDNAGFIAGQLYADAVVETAAPHAESALEPDITAIAAAIEAAESYDDLRERLRALYAGLDASELNELVYRAMLLGELAGRRAVTQDSEGE